MPKRDSMSEEYVADVLKKDAKDSSIKYSVMGLEAFLPKRPTVNAPKPNTRFLQNIIRETNNHNAALKAKEVEEAAARLRQLREERSRDVKRDWNDEIHNSRRKRKRQRVDEEGDRSPDDHHHRHRRRSPVSPKVLDDEPDEDEHRSHQSGRQKHAEDSVSDTSHRRKRHRHQREGRTRDRSRSKNGNRSRSKEHHKKRKQSPDNHARHRDAEAKKHKRRPRHRSRSRSPDFDLEKAYNKARRHRSHRKDRTSKSPPLRKSRTRRRASPDLSRQSAESATSHQTSDSDPLESLLGPALAPVPPTIKPRGRGALSSHSGIDSRFAASYDPTADVRANSGSEDDWEGALEAMRDRQRWRKQGAERLRAAGFDEKEVEKWEDGKEKTEEDVRWRGKGEGREWDRGKMVADDGSVVTGAEWGRLKGT